MAPVVRAKPALAAADGVATTVPGSLTTFFGHERGDPERRGRRGAGPVRQSDTPRRWGRLDHDQPGERPRLPDLARPARRRLRRGFVLADRMVVAAKDASPPAISSVTKPAAGPGGWFSAPVSVSWAVTDSASPVYAAIGCASASVSTAGSTSCSASSAGGTTAKTLSIRIDKTKPKKLKLKGIKKHYPQGAKPVKKKVKCKAKDPQSGIVKCKVKGLRTTPGMHTATAVATNGAGLVTKKRFSYTIL